MMQGPADTDAAGNLISLSVGDKYEAQDNSGNWWPVKVITGNPDGSYFIAGLDRRGPDWSGQKVQACDLRKFVVVEKILTDVEKCQEEMLEDPNVAEKDYTTA